eukprot:jgi/Psemu1/52016/gm1.52016_g
MVVPRGIHPNPPNVRITERPNAPTTRYITKEAPRAYDEGSISKPSSSKRSTTHLPDTSPKVQRTYKESISNDCTASPILYRVTDPSYLPTRRGPLVSIHQQQLPGRPLSCHSRRPLLTEYFQGAGQAIYTLFTEADGDRLLPLLLDIFNAQAIGGLGIFQQDAAGVDRLRGELVQLDAALLSRAAASRVYLLAHHEATIAQHPDRDYIPAIPEGTAHTEMLQAHKRPHTEAGLPSPPTSHLPARAGGYLQTTIGHPSGSGNTAHHSSGAIWLLEPGHPSELRPTSGLHERNVLSDDLQA